MLSQEYLDNLKQTLGIDLYQTPSTTLFQKHQKN